MSNYLRCPRCERIHGDIVNDTGPYLVVRRAGDTLYCKPTTVICRCDAIWTLREGWLYGRALDQAKPETITDEPASDDDARQNEVNDAQTNQIQPRARAANRRNAAGR